MEGGRRRELRGGVGRGSEGGLGRELRGGRGWPGGERSGFSGRGLEGGAGSDPGSRAELVLGAEPGQRRVVLEPAGVLERRVGRVSTQQGEDPADAGSFALEAP
jgi:hypothetical protein